MRKRVLLLPLILLVLLTGCVHNSPFTGSGEYFFQAMGKDGEIVVTADTERLKESMPAVLETGTVLDELFDRSTRLSISFYKDSYSESDPYPADLSSFDFHGGFEGNYGSFTVNTAISWSKEFHKEKQEGVKYYTNDEGTLNLAVPKSGLLLFASDDYIETYAELFSNRVLNIPSDTAENMAESLMGMYVRSPQTMINLGFDLPYSVIAKMSDAVLYVLEDGEDGSFYFNADITMQSEDLARTLLQLLRNQVVAALRLEGVRPDYKELAAQYSSEGNLVMLRGVEMSSDQVASFAGQISEISGGVL